MSVPPSPRTVLERLLAGITAGRWSELADLYAEDALVEQPLALPEPARLEGRAAVERHFAAAAGLPLTLRVERLRIHETGDPEVVVGEFDYEARNEATGTAARMANVQVIRVRDGRIVESRDYHDHTRLGQLARGLAT